MAFRPGRPTRPAPSGPTFAPGAFADTVPITPELIAPLIQAIASGVTSVWYADRRINFASIAHLIKALELIAGLGGLVAVSTPTRRFACFSKGLTHGGYGGAEHQEVWDTLWSRGVPPDPTRTGDVDWERAR